MRPIFITNLDEAEFKEILNEVVASNIENLANKLQQNEELISRKEAAGILQISLVTLNKYSKEGIVPCYKIGSRVRYKRQEVLAALESIRKH